MTIKLFLSILKKLRLWLKFWLKVANCISLMGLFLKCGVRLLVLLSLRVLLNLLAPWVCWCLLIILELVFVFCVNRWFVCCGRFGIYLGGAPKKGRTRIIYSQWLWSLVWACNSIFFDDLWFFQSSASRLKKVFFLCDILFNCEIIIKAQILLLVGWKSVWHLSLQTLLEDLKFLWGSTFMGTTIPPVEEGQ